MRLNANGQGDATFGIDGRALSTRTNVKDVAGMVRMPNGDIAVGYSDDFIGAAADSKDFFIEVFDANGQPKNIGGPEVANQRFVDLSTNGCDLTFLENFAHSLVVTAEGNLLVTGELTYRFSNTISPHGVAFAEFDGVSYAPTRAAWGIFPECRSTGGGFAYEHRLPDEPGNSLQRYARDAVGLGGGSVHVAGSYAFLSPPDVTAGQSNVRLGVGALNLSSTLPPGFWRNGNSIFNRIRLDRNDSSQLLLFGERESGTFGSGQLLRPRIGKSTGGTLTPFFFRPAGTASSTTITIQDGDRIPSSEQFWVTGGGAEYRGHLVRYLSARQSVCGGAGGFA